ncbi:hypothetical protein LY04_01078 [Oceanimonas baumannii]|uniref:Transposase n=1 Tax=Oceanimonas baumannii TaxID=129578 RepID=A0ABY2F0K3_9GAMM|nr:hypothetical protein LY04_01078 [Oceanimonas baumannii]
MLQQRYKETGSKTQMLYLPLKQKVRLTPHFNVINKGYWTWLS